MVRKYLSLVSLGLLSLQTFASNNSDEQASSQSAHPLYYEVNDRQHLSVKNEFNTLLEELNDLQVTPYWINQTGLDEVPQPEHSTKKVCIVDSGVDSNHPDLIDVNFNGNWSSYGGNWAEDAVGHGTHISGIIGAVNNGAGVRGAIDNGQIDVQIQKLVKSSRGSDSLITEESLIESIEICAGAGADIINLSLSGATYSNKLRDVIDRLTYQNDILFVAAAGNHGTATGIDAPAFPAAYRNVVGVGSININGQLAMFSPSYHGVELLAPGLDILSTIPALNNKVSSVYFESSEGFYEFDYYQIDQGLPHPTKLPSHRSCYHSLSDSLVTEQIVENKLSSKSKNEIDSALTQCLSDGGSSLVLTYDYLETVNKPEFESYNTWLVSLDYEATSPTLLMPGLNEEEVNFFQEGNITVSSFQQEYAALSGTSQSAGIVTAGIAKLWSNFPNASREQILNAVFSSSSIPAGNYPDNAVGNGAVHFGDAFAFMNDYQNSYQEPECPAAWYDNAPYNGSEQVTFKGTIYQANYWTKNQRPDSHSGEYQSWKAIGECANPPTGSYDYVEDEQDPYYELNEEDEIEVITVTYKCNSYTLSCGGGGGFGGFGGISFGGGSSGGSYGGGGGGGGGSSNSDSDSEHEKKKQEEYDDIKKRSENKPKQKPGESNEDYNKRLAQYYKKLAADYKKWDDKYNKGRHTQKIRDILNRANKYEKAYQNAVRHREVTERYKNGQKGKSPLCKTKTRGLVKVIQTVGCLFDEP